MVFLNKFYTIFHFLSLCVFISIQNIGGSIPLTKTFSKAINRFDSLQNTSINHRFLIFAVIIIFNETGAIFFEYQYFLIKMVL